jgi:hypothetical protein
MLAQWMPMPPLVPAVVIKLVVLALVFSLFHRRWVAIAAAAWGFAAAFWKTGVYFSWWGVTA